MTDQVPAPPDDPDVAPVSVVVGRSIGGGVLILVGVAVLAGTAFMVLVAPFLGGALADWSEWLVDLFWIPGAIGLGLVVGGGTMIRRARKRSLDEPVDPVALARAQAEAAASFSAAPRDDDPPSVAPPTTVL